jgi:hypothetical protein
MTVGGDDFDFCACVGRILDDDGLRSSWKEERSLSVDERFVRPCAIARINVRITSVWPSTADAQESSE